VTLKQRLGSVEAIALVIADDRLWRITASHGRNTVADLGAFASWQDALSRFEATPTDAAQSADLGARLFGPEPFRATDAALLVVLDSQVAALPIGALRIDGKPLVAWRPIVRVPRLSDVGCAPPVPEPPRAVVLADPRGDLPSARSEANDIARMLGVSAVTGAAVTRDRLLDAVRSDVLDVAVHANVDAAGGSLELYDQPLSALEIIEGGHAPALVMLSACASAASDDGEQWTSLANAFLASGSSYVVATLRSVSDRGAHNIATAFFRAGGVHDPARALARVQTDAANSTNPDWPNFVLYGHDTCPKEQKL
jgi:CHAT domain-containing protein